MKHLAVIPARGGSKRIEKKNIRHFKGVPIIGRVIQQLNKSQKFDKVIVSTDNDEISNISRKYGAEVPFKRPENISDDQTSVVEVVRHAVNFFNQSNDKYDTITMVYPTAVLIQTGDLDKALNLIGKNDFAISVSENPFPIERSLILNEDNDFIEMRDKSNFLKRSQDLPKSFYDAGQFIVGQNRSWISKLPMIEGRNIPIIIPRTRVMDIDTEEDWIEAELKFSIIEKLDEEVGKN